MRQILSKKFLKYFLISFLILEVLLLINFIGRDYEDIFEKGIPNVEIFKFIYYSFLSLFGFGLLFGILMATIFAFRYFSLNQQFAFKLNIVSGLIITFLISILYFSYNNWIMPKVNLELYAMIYDMKNTAPNAEFKKVDRNLFRDSQVALSIKEIKLHIDTLNNEIKKNIQKCDSLLLLLPDSVALEIYNSSELDKFGVIFKNNVSDTLSEREINRAGNYLKSFGHKLKMLFEKKHRFQSEKSKRIILPIELLLLYLIGASFGYYYNDQKVFLLVVLGLYTTSFFYGTILGFEKMISNSLSENSQGTFISVFILLIITAIFLFKSNSKEKNNAT